MGGPFSVFHLLVCAPMGIACDYSILFCLLFVGYTTTLFVSLGPVCHCGVPECETGQHDNVMEEWAWIPCHYTPLSS